MDIVNDMKVLHLISGGDTGGAKTHVISLVKELDRLIDVNIICFIEDVFYEEALEAGIDIQVSKQSRRTDLSIIKKLRDEIEEKNYDIIHCHGARANFIGMLLARQVDRPFITTIHSDYRLDFKDSFYKRMIYTPLNSLALKKFHYYIAISDTFKTMLVERNFKEEKIFTVYNGIDIDTPLDYVPREQFLSRYDILGDQKVIIGIMGRLDLVKDHETFIKAAANVLETKKDIIFLIGGTVKDEGRLKALVQDMGLEEHIYFLGFVQEPYSFFNAIDVNVLTSISESFPYVLMEGALLKKPAISTKVGGIHRLIDDGISGYLIDVGDWKSLAKDILLLAEDRSKIESMGENLYETVRINFSSRKMAQEHYKIYEKILEVRRQNHEDNR